MNRRRWTLVGLWLTVTAPLWLFPLAWSLAFTPNEVVSTAGHYLAQMEFIGALLFLLCVPVLLCYRQYRRGAIHIGALALVFVTCYFVGMAWGRSVRQHELDQVPGRAQPLVNAIAAYEAKNGRPPDSLDDLVPAYLNQLPHTGVGHHPNFYYFKVDPATHRGNSWVLHGPAPGVVFAFDTFSYYPRQNYDELGLSPIGNWGYLQD